LRPHLDFSDTVPEWIGAEWASRIHLPHRWRADRLPLALPSYWQRQRYAPYLIARKHVNADNVVAFAASQGIELRHPFHDLRLTEYLLGVPGALLLRGRRRKCLLREAMKGILPETVRLRDTKGGFITPFLEAFGRPGAPDVETLEVVRRGWIDGRTLSRYRSTYSRWYEEDRLAKPPALRFGVVWSAAAMDMWLRHAFRG
jgi:asparagine synthase (glutamine-hydrolysing)